VEQVTEESLGLDLNAANVETVLNEIRPYLVGTGGGELQLSGIDGVIVKVRAVREGSMGGAAKRPRQPGHTVQDPAQKQAQDVALQSGRARSPGRRGAVSIAADELRVLLVAQIRITGPAANVMTVRVAVTQKLREKIPGIAAVQLL
jgi:hypothetical protein